MKSVQYELPYGIFGGVFGVIAEPLQKSRDFPIAAAERIAVPEAAPPASEGTLARLGQWLMRRQMKGVAPLLARSNDVFDRLDRWMWRQQNRQIESYLAGSTDVFDLERRLQALERGQAARVL